MALKVSFKFDKTKFRGTHEEINQAITNAITAKLNELRIEHSRAYTPSRVSIKILFPTEDQINKVLDSTEALKTAGFEPRSSMALKSSRTIFCFGFDLAILTAYTAQNLTDHLIEKGWKVRGIYIMNSKKAFKVEFHSSKEAKKLKCKGYIYRSC